jgi:uncharacterized protein (TIGR02246 family)
MNSRFTKFAGFVLMLSLVAALMIACQPIRPEGAQAQSAGPSEEEQFIETALAMEAAYQDEDMERVAEFYAEDAVSHVPGLPADVGQEAIKAAYQAFFDTYDLERDFELTDVKLSGDYATRTGEWTQVLTPTDGSAPITEIGRCVLGWEKINGEWKIVWEIWNTYETTPAQ